MFKRNRLALCRRHFLQSSMAGLAALGTRAWSQPPASGADLCNLSLTQASAMIQSGNASPRDLVEACLERIARYNPALNAFILVTAEQALAQADALERELQNGNNRGPLHGIPIAIKDNIDTAGIATTGASDLFKERIPEEDAEVVRRLKQAGAIVLGKLNLNEFAYGGSATVTAFGPVKNPWSEAHVTGGSSSGSGSAVAADLCFAALGTDTAGSVRMPSSHCGITGLKPSYGLVSTRGVLMLSWTLDHVGPMCKSVADTALMLSAMAGYDPREPTSLNHAPPDYMAALSRPAKPLRLGIPREPYFNDLHPDVAKVMESAIATLTSLCAETRPATLPRAVSGARLWGPEAYAFHTPWIVDSPQLYMPETRGRLEQFELAGAQDYVLARREVDMQRQRIHEVFEHVDILVTPIMRTPPPLMADGGNGGSSANPADFNVFGLPAIVVPAGFSSEGLPIGLQLVGPPLGDELVLALGHAWQQATDWHLRKPVLSSLSA